MVQVSLHCPFCNTTRVTKYGICNGKQRYKCHNDACKRKTFYAEYTYNGSKPEVKKQIITMTTDSVGVRSIARILGVSTATVISDIKKKESELSSTNTDYFARHTHGRARKIRIEMDEMWSFYYSKDHQIWLWWAIDHDTGEVIAYWFGSREHNNLGELKKLLSPLQIEIVYSDGNSAYSKGFSSKVLIVSKSNLQKIERKHLSLRTWSSRLVRDGIRFSKTEKMHKIAVGLVINIRFFGNKSLAQ